MIPVVHPLLSYKSPEQMLSPCHPIRTTRQAQLQRGLGTGTVDPSTQPPKTWMCWVQGWRDLGLSG